MRVPTIIRRSISSGVFVWLVYGLAEFGLAYGTHHRLLFLSWQWKLLGLLFAAYAFFGAVLGAAAGVALALIRKDNSVYEREARVRIGAALTLTAAFVLNLLTGWPLPPQEHLCFAVAVALTALFTAAAASDEWLKRVAFLANPWFLAPLLLSAAWASFEMPLGRSEPVKTGLPVLLVSITVAAAACCRRWRGSWPRWRMLGAVMVAASAGLLLLQWQPSTRGTGGQKASANRSSNVLLITMDTVRADHLPMYGYSRDTAPHLREFARGATLYRHAMAVADMTLPAHASIFTGVYPDSHGASLGVPGYPIGRPLPSRYRTLAEVLRGSGYQTAAVVANWAYLAPWFGFYRGFSEYDSYRPVRITDWERPFLLSVAAQKILGLLINTNEFDAVSLRAADVNQRALRWLSRVDQGKPFFLFLNYMDAHAPYIPPRPFDAAFPGRIPKFTPGLGYESVHRAVIDREYHLTERERRHITSQYDGGIAYMDSEIGKLLGELRARGLYENTLIVITADHGEAIGEHNLMEHSTGFLYEDQVHVPLFVKYPGQHEARESSALASEVDLMPTILGIAGIPFSGLQGQSLQSPRTEESEPIYASDRAFAYLSKYSRFRGVRHAIVAGHYKLITWSAGPPEFYDLAKDPGEVSNIYRSDDPRVEELQARLNAWSASIPHRPLRRPASPSGQQELKRVKSLGYVE